MATNDPMAEVPYQVPPPIPPRYSSGIENPHISSGGSPVNPTAAPTAGEEIPIPQNIDGNIGEGESHQLFSLEMRPRAPPNAPSFPKLRRQIDPRSFTLTPIPQGDVLRALAPPEAPRSLKDKIATRCIIISLNSCSQKDFFL